MAKINYIGCTILLLLISLCATGQRHLSEDRQALIKTYRKDIGITEATNNNDGSRVAYFQQMAGLDTTTHPPYCAAFVYSSHIEAGIDIDYPLPAWSPTWAENGEIIFEKGRAKTVVLPGDVATIYSSQKGRASHTFFIDGEGKEFFITVQANIRSPTSGKEGVWRRKIKKKLIHRITRHIE